MHTMEQHLQLCVVSRQSGLLRGQVVHTDSRNMASCVYTFSNIVLLYTSGLSLRM